MKLCILEADRPTDALEAAYGTYAGMFETWLGPVLPEAEFTRLFVAGGAALPEAPARFDGYLITGSRAGVYEDHAWIPPLEAFLRAAAEARRPILGVCFGHQIMARAFGGEVTKSAAGWQLGRQEHSVTEAGAARFGAAPLLALSFHQDQVTVAPPGAACLMTNAASPHGGFEYYDFPALSVQFHPEFGAAFVADLLDLAAGLRVPEERAEAAREGLAGPLDNGRVADGFAEFLRAHIQ